ncbi:Dolichyl-phosphate-mannose-protein mannosyltransferase, putative [Trichomonas vaginalis G3]|uniref:Dolichyl-phosphate-mannose-protein mannosyltransferase, putative n=1 Tax=Trichomonas vaginalis (strain ATCC PRA-98 / G3) TaxID=412133 RepID=A2DWB1_TRIV3|nr:dolichyl-phosphate-mannose-protein mannosyltransferase protein [Trichomonas vaginalis G3]EAY15251.1 Dolichyl-phosphate-mannose-protein mannosyltransferase, putative [Trichomonas vaginalis G3]KAI5526445.1 dolichyl-phosphate-mannose-protein mannosyltransferase protein [Trichomonas vaginalis G3]|eukprot:XP_001327474.1 Dolichyl-phosphate-mannose-protein mannosyltransferase [Trichomonas vaginalis G3]
MFFGFLSRNFRIQYPEARIFDEIYFGNFTNYYLRNEYFFDIHPPLGKLIFALFAKLSLDPATTNYERAISSYTEKYYITLRMTSASFSSLVAPYGFVTMRLFGFSYIASLFTGFYLAVDFMLIVEGRLILTDGILHSFVMLAVFLIALLHAHPESYIALIFAGIGCGCCSSVKLTALSIYAFAALQQLLYVTGGNVLRIFTEFNPSDFNKKNLKSKEFYKNNLPARYILRLFIIIFTGIFTTFSLFCVHVIICVYKGPGNQAMPDIFQGTVIDKTSYPDFTDHVNKTSLIRRVVKLYRFMHHYNMRITSPHSAQSNWYDWPLCRMKSIPYYTANWMSLVLTPNFLVWYSAALGAFASLIISIWAFVTGKWNLLWISIWPCGYFASWLPFALIPGSLFVYHYLVPLMFGVFCFSTSIDILFQNCRIISSCLFSLMIFFAFVLWIFYTPWLYGMVGYEWKSREWYKDFF